jgi:hypothetical protein
MSHLVHLVSLDALQGSLSSTRKEGKVVILWGGKEHRAANIQMPVTLLLLGIIIELFDSVRAASAAYAKNGK